MTSSAPSAPKAKRLLIQRIIALGAQQKPANIPMVDKFLRSKPFQECSRALENFARSRHKQGVKRIPAPPELLPPIF